MKIDKLMGWVSLTAINGTPLFSLYNSSYKFFQTKFFKLCCHTEDKERRLFFHSNHSLRFPLYWQKPIRFPPRPDHQLALEEKEAIDAIRQLHRPLNTQAILCLPHVEDPNALFIGICFCVCMFPWLSYLSSLLFCRNHGSKCTYEKTTSSSRQPSGSGR